jgi:hypothetical protein
METYENILQKLTLKDFKRKLKEKKENQLVGDFLNI